MRLVLFIFLFFACLRVSGHGHIDRGLPRSEVGLMNNVLGCLSHKDTVGYFALFPPFDSLWAMVIYNHDPSPDVVRDLDNLKAHPQALLQFDPVFNHQIMARFVHVLQKGEDSGIHWDNIVLLRYQLIKEENTSRSLVGYDRIVPERFQGYVFVHDMLGRQTFCISLTEIQKINGYFFGGQVLNILEASSVDEFVQREADEQKYFDWLAKHKDDDTAKADSTKGTDAIAKANGNANYLNVTPQDDDSSKVRREVVDRKYYEGKFDNDIPVVLFIRYMKDFKTGTVRFYDGLYKFGDQVKFVRLTITRDTDGKWMMEDDVPIGTMELQLKNKVYTGTWTNDETQTGYEVELKQTVASEMVIEKLDRMLETGVLGRVDEEPAQAGADNVKIDGMDNEADTQPQSPPPVKAKRKKEKKEKSQSTDDNDD